MDRNPVIFTSVIILIIVFYILWITLYTGRPAVGKYGNEHAFIVSLVNLSRAIARKIGIPELPLLMKNIHPLNVFQNMKSRYEALPSEKPTWYHINTGDSVPSYVDCRQFSIWLLDPTTDLLELAVLLFNLEYVDIRSLVTLVPVEWAAFVKAARHLALAYQKRVCNRYGNSAGLVTSQLTSVIFNKLYSQLLESIPASELADGIAPMLYLVADIAIIR